MKLRSPAVLVAALAALLTAAPVPAQSKRPMTLVDLIEVPSISDPHLSADGRQVLYLVSKADWKQGRKIGHIWRVNADGSDARQMTFGERGESSPRWAPDGTRFAFLARRGETEDTQIYLLENAGGEARQLSKHATAASDLQWSPDGTTIYFIAPDPNSDDETARDRLKDDVFAFDENYKQRHLWKIAVADGKESRITEGDYSVSSYSLSRDGARVLVGRTPSPLLGDRDLGELWVMDITGRSATQLTRNAVGESNARFSPDGARVLFIAEGHPQFERYHQDGVWIQPVSTGPAELLLSAFTYEIDSADWAPDGGTIYLIANMGVHSELFAVDVATKTPRQLTDGRHAIQNWSLVASAAKHVFQIDEPTRFGEVWTMAVAAAAKPRPTMVTHVYDAYERDFKLPRQEKVEWKGADGVKVEGILFYPVDYEAGKRYPLVVQTHGGPRSSDKFGFGGWSSYIQVLTGKGYAVLRPNYRGSTGYGNHFMRDMVGNYFRNAHLDVMAGVDHVIRMGVADPDRLVKMGWSAGGHMTNKIITFTNRFKAASSGAGAANWVSMYAQSDIRADRTPWFGGTPWQKNAPIDAYWASSPLKDVANVTTPTLFLVGQNDPRVPPPQSIEMYRALKSNGVPTRLYIAPREGHGWTELRHQLFKGNVELEWFEKHALGRTYTWERAPGEPQLKDLRKTEQSDQRRN